MSTRNGPLVRLKLTVTHMGWLCHVHRSKDVHRLLRDLQVSLLLSVTDFEESSKHFPRR